MIITQLFLFILYLSISFAKSWHRGCARCPMDPVTRVRELSALYRKYITGTEFERVSDLTGPNYSNSSTIIWHGLQCCPLDHAFMVVLTQDYQCFDGGAKLLRDGSVIINSTCIFQYGGHHATPLGFNFTQYWKPAPGICNYKLNREVAFDLFCANYNATCEV